MIDDWEKPRHSCTAFMCKNSTMIGKVTTPKYECISKEEFDNLAKSDEFEDGPHMEGFGDGYGHPYNPWRQAFGKLKDGRLVFTELYKFKSKEEEQQDIKRNTEEVVSALEEGYVDVEIEPIYEDSVPGKALLCVRCHPDGVKAIHFHEVKGKGHQLESCCGECCIVWDEGICFECGTELQNSPDGPWCKTCDPDAPTKFHVQESEGHHV